MGDRDKASDAAKNKPDTKSDSSAESCKKPPCPDGCSKVPKITAKKATYTVVLDKAGNLFAGYPILEFEITDGCPNHLIDVQIAKKDAALLTGGPGLANSWDKTKLPKDRITQQAFSSWTNGETSIKLDGAGKATYKMPLDWWKDLARQPRKIFTTMPIHFRVLAFCDKSTAPVNSTVSHIDVKNNLVDFKVVDKGYISGGTVKSIEMSFTVEVANTTEMYTIVQWNLGSAKIWRGSVMRFSLTTDYNEDHEYNIPEWAIDRLKTNPRYHDSNFDISPDKKTATTTDKPGSEPLSAPDTKNYISTDWDTRVHLNVDVPSTVTIKRREGTASPYKILIGIISPPEPLILDSSTWNIRILKIIDSTTGVVTLTHPATFTGP